MMILKPNGKALTSQFGGAQPSHKTLILGIPGMGKTTLVKNCSHMAVDLDYKILENGCNVAKKMTPPWGPITYQQTALVNEWFTQGVSVVTTFQGWILPNCLDPDIHLVIACFLDFDLESYLQRFIKRGDSSRFLDHVKNHGAQWNYELREYAHRVSMDRPLTLLQLSSDQYLSDVLEESDHLTIQT